jgi:hypothetical protein
LVDSCRRGKLGAFTLGAQPMLKSVRSPCFAALLTLFAVAANAATPPSSNGSAVGDLVMSFLPEAAFNAEHAGQTWRLCAGGAAPGTRWAALTNNAPLPDCRGRYPRQFMDGLTPPVGQTQEDALQQHTHGLGGYDYGITYGASNQGQNLAAPPDGFHGQTNGVTGARVDSETRPKTIVVNFFVRVN